MFIDCVYILLIVIPIASSNASITSISNPQTKNLKNADLAGVPQQDAEALEKAIKINENGERVLRRKTTSTDIKLVSTESVNKTGVQEVKIATEGSGVTKVAIVNGAKVDNVALSNVTSPEVVKDAVNSTKPSVVTSVGNSTRLSQQLNSTIKSESGTINSTSSTVASQNTTKVNLEPSSTTAKLNASSTVPSTPISTSTTTTTTSTTTTTTSTTTTTTTTPKPKKPTVTYSVDDKPEIADTVPEHSNSLFPVESKPSAPKLSVDEPEQPLAQPSQEFDGVHYRNNREYIIPIVSIIFAVPILMGMAIVAYRRIRDFWSTRHYRRMDFLVDGMYND